MTDKLIPKYFITKSVLYHHQPEITPPIGRIHVYDNFLFRGYNAYMAHLTQTTPYCTFVYIILLRQLRECLLSLYVSGYNVLCFNTFATYELASAIKAFV